jgi:hypothetical protein
MKKMTSPMILLVALTFSSCAPEKTTVPAPPPPSVQGVPVVEAKGYPPFRILMLGDSYCGTISSNLQIRFDCGGLAGTYAYEQHGKRDVRGRCVVLRTTDRVAATIVGPPAGKKSEYYPINVFSPNQNVKADEVKRLAFEIEKAVLKK